jgi:hypothetical protein
MEFPGGRGDPWPTMAPETPARPHSHWGGDATMVHDAFLGPVRPAWLSGRCLKKALNRGRIPVASAPFFGTMVGA